MPAFTLTVVSTPDNPLVMGTNLAVMAEGAGIVSILTVEAADQLDAAATFLVEAPAPRFLWVRVMPGPPADYKRNWDLAECRLKFRNAYLARHNRT